MLLVTKRDRWYRNKLRAIFRGVRACPRHDWATVVAKLNEGGGSWRTERLVRAMKLLVAEHLAEPALLGRAPRKSANRRARDAAAAMRRASPTISLQEIGRQLQAMAIPSTRGHLSWSRDHVFKWRRR